MGYHTPPTFDWSPDKRADTVRLCRRYLGMTYKEFADALGLANDGARHARRWESGERSIGAENQSKIESLVKEAHIEGEQSDHPRQYE